MILLLSSMLCATVPKIWRSTSLAACCPSILHSVQRNSAVISVATKELFVFFMPRFARAKHTNEMNNKEINWDAARAQKEGRDKKAITIIVHSHPFGSPVVCSCIATCDGVVVKTHTEFRNENRNKTENGIRMARANEWKNRIKLAKWQKE